MAVKSAELAVAAVVPGAVDALPATDVLDSPPGVDDVLASDDEVLASEDVLASDDDELSSTVDDVELSSVEEVELSPLAPIEFAVAVTVSADTAAAPMMASHLARDLVGFDLVDVIELSSR